MKGNKKMEIIIAVIGALISSIITCFVMSALFNYNIETEIQRTKKEYEADIQEGQEKLDRYRETLDGFIERHNALKEKLSEKDKEISKLKYHLKTAEKVIGLIEDELNALEPMTEKAQKSRLPKGHTNMFMGMPYDLITDKASDQYALQKECITVKSTGIRMYDAGETGYYCAALGGAYGTDIGDTWHVTLKNGSEFNIILADYKHPIDNPDPNDFGDPCKNYDGEDCTNVIEFVFDGDYLPREVLIAGTFSKLTFFGGLYGDGGDIVKMEYTGRVWSR